MKKIFISIFTILTILIVLSSFAYASNYIRPTLSEVQVLLEASTEYKTISMLNNKTLQITHNVDGLAKPITVNLYYDNIKDIFYTEEIFDNSMDNTTISAKFDLLLQLPIQGFSTVAEKNEVDTMVNSTYTLEKSLDSIMYANMAVSTMLDSSPTDKITSLDALIDKKFENNTNIDCEYFTTKLEKTTTASNITIKNTLTIKTDADFSKMGDYSIVVQEQKQNLENAKNNADYKLYLQAGETETIYLGGKIAYGYTKNDITDSCMGIQISEENFIFNAKTTGEDFGVLTFVDSIDNKGNPVGKVEKTFYVSVSKKDIVLNTNTLNNNVISNKVDISNGITTDTMIANNINSNTNANTIYTSNTISNNTIVSSPNTNTPKNSVVNSPRNSVVNMPKNSVVNELPDAGINSSVITILKIVLSLAILALIIFTSYNISNKKDN